MKKSRCMYVSLMAIMGIALACTLSACGKQDSQSPQKQNQQTSQVQLQVFAANSLEKAMPEVQKLYQAKHPEVSFADTQFKASGDLVQSLKAGAPCDVLICASQSTMDSAQNDNLIDTQTCIDMFKNNLVIVTGQNQNITLSSLADVKNLNAKIAIGDAQTVPAGKYANQALASVGLYSSDEGKGGTYDSSIAQNINLADKVGTAAKYVSTGDCVIGFVYSSDVYRYSGIKTIFTCPESSHKPIVYPGAVCSQSKNAQQSKDFMNFCMNDPEAQKVWAKYGFELAQH